MFGARYLGLALALPLCFVGNALTSEPIAEWQVKNKLLGEAKENGEGSKKSVDVSGIACSRQHGFPRRCVVIDDELQDAQYVELIDGKVIAKSPIHLIDDVFNSKKLSLDGEGVAYAAPYFYVIGSHGHPRDPEGKLDRDNDAQLIRARIDASAKIIRFRDSDQSEIEVSTRLMPYIIDQIELTNHVDQRLEKDGVTIEGIAVSNGRLYAGFRGPAVNGNKAAILTINVDALFDEAPAASELFLLSLGAGRGVRDLTTYRDGFLVLAGPSKDNRGDYAIYWWNGINQQTSLLGHLEIDDPDNSRKPEGILALDEKDGLLRVLILFDGKSAKEGTPTTFQIKAP